MTITISDEPWGKNVRRRVRWKSTKTRRTVWWQFTNQPTPKERDWAYGEGIYVVSTAPRGAIDVYVPESCRADRHMFTPEVVERFLTDLVDISGESRRAYNRRRG